MPRSRRLIRLTLGGTLLLAGMLVAAFGASADSKNLLVNPGFEDGIADHPWMPAGWDTSRAGTETVLFSRDAYSAHSGAFGVGIANASTGLPLWHNWSQTVPVTQDMWGKDAEFTVWTKSNGVDGRGYVLIQAYRDTVGVMARKWKVTREVAGRRLGLAGVNDPLLDVGWKREPFAERETDWVQRTLSLYVAPSTNYLTVRIGIFGLGQVLFDDASLTMNDPTRPPVLPLHTNLLADPGFELGSLPWELSIPIYPGYIAQPDTTSPHSGNYCFSFKLEHGLVAGRAGVSQVIGNRSIAGKHIRYSAWVRSDSLRSQVFLTVYFHRRVGSSSAIAPDRVTGSMPWTQLTLEADVPADTFELWALLEYSAPVAGHVWFDDASLEILGPAKPASTRK